jgi:flagellar biosynthesis regulator FlaF
MQLLAVTGKGLHWNAIQLLCRAEAARPSSQEADAALDFAGRLWNAFVQDLRDPENDLPCVLKAEIISIGQWIIKEAALIRRGSGVAPRDISIQREIDEWTSYQLC